MSKHTPFVEDGVDPDCYYGECEHYDGDCQPVRMVACEGCYAEAEPDAEDIVWLTNWPCIHTTRTGREDAVIAQLLDPAVLVPAKDET